MAQLTDHFSPNQQNSRSQNGRTKGSREKIFSTAARLFWNKGYKGTSLNDIAKAARVNKATIYYHFKNKMAILYEITVSAIFDIMELTKPILESELSSQEKLRALIDNHIKWQIAHPGRVGFYPLLKLNLTPKLFSDYLHARDEYLAVFQKVIDQGIVEGSFKHMATQYDAFFIVVFLNSLAQRLDTNQHLSIDETVSSAYQVISQTLKLESS